MNVDDINSTDEEDFESTRSETYQRISLAPMPATLWPPSLSVGPKDLSKERNKLTLSGGDTKSMIPTGDSRQHSTGVGDLENTSSDLQNI